MIRDGDSMRVAAKIAQGVFRAAKRWLGVDNPPVAISPAYQLGEDLGPG